jgi:hypothetical protein
MTIAECCDYIKNLINELKNLPFSLFLKEGDSSLSKREVRRDFFLIMFFLCLMVACSSETPSDTSNQLISEEGKNGVSGTLQAPADGASDLLEINPFEATRNSTLNLTMKGFNGLEAKIEWLVNGKPAAPQAVPDQFKASETRRGDTVQAKAVTGGKEILSNTVMIKNTPPELSRVKIMPEAFKPGDRLYVDAAGSDIDGDDVSINFTWTVNGEPAGNSKEVGVQIKRGDRLSVKVTPFDGETYGDSITLNREVRNLPPLIAEDKEFTFDGKTYTYRIKATDPDGDNLTYSVKTGPDGLAIDSSGMIKWDVPLDFRGKAPVSVAVLDSNGGETRLNFNIDITTGKK